MNRSPKQMNRSPNHQRSADRSQSAPRTRLSPLRRRPLIPTAGGHDTAPEGGRDILQAPAGGRGVIELMDGDGLPGGPAPTQVFVDAVAMAAGMLGWAQDAVCYTPATVSPGVCHAHELMRASLAISDAHRADGFATAPHYMVGRGTDGGAYIFLVPGVCGPAMKAHEMAAVGTLLGGRVHPIAVLFRRADFDPLHRRMAVKPQRVWPVGQNGSLSYVGGSGGGRLVGRTLDETLDAR